MMATPSEFSFHLRGTHLYIMLDDVAKKGSQDIVEYLNHLVKTNRRVESVFVKGAMSRYAGGRIPNAIALAVFGALSGLSMIERLEVSGDGRFGGLFLPVRAMTLALQNRPQYLFSLRLGNVILTTPPSINDEHESSSSSIIMEDFASALESIPSLTIIDLVRCRAESERVTLEPLVRAISSMSTIQQAMFCETLISSNSTGSYLSEVCKSPSLKKLWWKTMPDLNDDHIMAMAQQLKSNEILTELTVRSRGLGKEAGKAIADLLLHNTTLQVINLDLDRAEYGLNIATALHKNTTLTCLDVWAWGGEMDSKNSGSCAITEAFTTMLQHNHVLKFLTFQGLDWNNPQVDFYLRLNRAGRRQLLKSFDDKTRWIEALSKQKEDIQVLYHFLSINPSLCRVEAVRRPIFCDEKEVGYKRKAKSLSETEIKHIKP